MGSFASTAYELAQAASGEAGVTGAAAGMGGVMRAAGGVALYGARNVAGSAAASLRESVDAGRGAAWTATGGEASAPSPASVKAPVDRAPGWAMRLQSDAAIRTGAHAARQAVHDGDRPGHGANPSLHKKED
ncbi:MAG: hypothetical protein FJX45_13635 [Alphaproteobacteria bacterium]|nr:hypothetical protein [Alphaproteobacteria bacterium]